MGQSWNVAGISPCTGDSGVQAGCSQQRCPLAKGPGLLPRLLWNCGLCFVQLFTAGTRTIRNSNTWMGWGEAQVFPCQCYIISGKLKFNDLACWRFVSQKGSRFQSLVSLLRWLWLNPSAAWVLVSSVWKHPNKTLLMWVNYPELPFSAFLLLTWPWE